MAFQSDPYSEDLTTIPVNAWTLVGSLVAAGKHRCVNISYSCDLADTVSMHIGSAAPAGNPNLRNSLVLDDGGGLMSNPHVIKAGEGLWVKAVLGKGAARAEGFEEAN